MQEISKHQKKRAIKSELRYQKNIKSKLTGIEFLSQKRCSIRIKCNVSNIEILSRYNEEFKRYIEGEKNRLLDLETPILQLLVDENNKSRNSK